MLATRNNFILLLDVILLLLIFNLDVNIRLYFIIPLLLLNCIILYKRKSNIKPTSKYMLIIVIVATIAITLINYFFTVK